jgi:hypothetical protein
MLTPQDIALVEQRASGATFRQIETITGVDHATAARRLSKPELKEHIEALQEKLVTHALDKAASNLINLVDNYETATEPQRIEHGYKASVEVLRATGILVSNTQPMFIQQIFNHTDVHITQEVDQLHSFLASQMSNIIDVEPEDPTP